jgi:hypothetical protein
MLPFDHSRAIGPGRYFVLDPIAALAVDTLAVDREAVGCDSASGPKSWSITTS